MKNLISMADFVLEQKERLNCLLSHNAFEYYKLTSRYAQFLKQPLELWMFVPCSEEGNVLSEKYNAKEDTENKSFTKLSNEYEIAKLRCLFKGFKVISQDLYDNYFELELHGKDFWITFVNNKCQIEEDFEIENIEHLLLNMTDNLHITETAIKQLGLSDN